jgi:uncharacterized protein YndB with AHSA1/START domain
MTDRSLTHSTFVIERTYPADVSRVFAAWAEKQAREIWRDDPDFKSDGTDYELEFRVGGRERFSGVAPDGSPYRYDGVIHDIVPDSRIVYSYEMYSGERRMSVSLSTVELATATEGTKLTYTEQDVFLDGIDKPEDREEGTAWLLDNLGKYLMAPVVR